MRSGKSANIILNDADLDLAIKQSQVGLFLNMGQCCIAGSRVFVQEGIYDEFVKRTVEASRKRVVGDPFAPNTDHGAQIDGEQFNRIMGYIAAGKKEGAKLSTGGNRVGNKGWFIEPTVFSDVKVKSARRRMACTAHVPRSTTCRMSTSLPRRRFSAPSCRFSRQASSD